METVSTGERPLAAMTLLDGAFQKIDQGVNIYVVFPDEGLPIAYEIIGILPTPPIRRSEAFVDYVRAASADALADQVSPLRCVTTSNHWCDRGRKPLSEIKILSSNAEDQQKLYQQQEELLASGACCSSGAPSNLTTGCRVSCFRTGVRRPDFSRATLQVHAPVILVFAAWPNGWALYVGHLTQSHEAHGGQASRAPIRCSTCRRSPSPSCACSSSIKSISFSTWRFAVPMAASRCSGSRPPTAAERLELPSAPRHRHWNVAQLDGDGELLAWAVVRTDMPGRRVIELALIAVRLVPFVGALAGFACRPATSISSALGRAGRRKSVDQHLFDLGHHLHRLPSMDALRLPCRRRARAGGPEPEEHRCHPARACCAPPSAATLPLVPASLPARCRFRALGRAVGVPAVLGARPHPRADHQHRRNPGFLSAPVRLGARSA